MISGTPRIDAITLTAFKADVAGEPRLIAKAALLDKGTKIVHAVVEALDMTTWSEKTMTALEVLAKAIEEDMAEVYLEDVERKDTALELLHGGIAEHLNGDDAPPA